MNVTQEYVADLLNRMGKSKRQNAKDHEGLYEDCCHRNEDKSIEVWCYFERYTEYWGFPDKDDDCARLSVESEDVGVLASNLVSFKYPDLQNIFAHKIVLGEKGIPVLNLLYAMEASLSRDTAIYAILHNAFYYDLRKCSFELPNYIGIGNPEWFVRVFFTELYRYDGIYSEDIYSTIISSIGGLCNLPETYLRDNIGSILVVIEQCYDTLDADKKKELLIALDGMLLTDDFIIKEYNEAVDRVVKARCKLLKDLYSANYLDAFETEMRQNMVRFEGWLISNDAKYREIDREVSVILSWIEAAIGTEIQPEDKEHILNSVYKRLQAQIVLAKKENEPYEEALDFLINSLDPNIPFCASIITDFIVNTNNLYFVLHTISETVNVDATQVELIQERWEKEKDIVEIKANQENLWMDSVKKLAQSLGIDTD